MKYVVMEVCWMFLTSVNRSIAPTLQAIADGIEQSTPGLYVVAAKQYRYPIVQSAMDVWVTEPRRFNVLEEFILRSALELEPSPPLSELAEVLGLDLIFLEKTFRDLSGLAALALGEGSRIMLTPLGRSYYEEGQVPQPPKKEPVYFLFDSLTASITAQKNRSTTIETEVAALTDVFDLPVELNFAYNLSFEQGEEILLSSSLGVHDPKQGKVASRIDVASAGEQVWQPVSIYLLYDDLEQRWAMQARKGNTWIAGAQPLLDQITAEGPEAFLKHFDLPSIPELPCADVELLDPPEDQERFARIQELAKEAMWRGRNPIQTPDDPVPDVNIGTLTVLRNENIRPEFLNLLRAAKREVIVFSPWVNEQVVDNEFIALLQELAAANVWILLGHGIARTHDREDRPLPANAINRIHAIRSPQGAPVARVVWLGGSHSKEVVVDNQVYLHGSFNWLSYRGDRCVRGETVSRITIPDTVAEARAVYSDLFLKRAAELWMESGHYRGSADGLTSLSIMGALGKESEALKMIDSTSRYDLLSDWTRIIINNLVHGDVVQAAVYLEEASCLFSRILPESLIGDDFRVVWKEAIKQIHRKDSGLAYDLLSQPSWEYYAGLGLASPLDTPEEYLSALVRPKAPVSDKKIKKKTKKR